MRVIEPNVLPIIDLDGFCEHQIIGDDIHAIGYQVRRDANGGEEFGVVEVRIKMNAKKFFEVCRRGVQAAETGQLPPETAFVTRSHH